MKKNLTIILLIACVITAAAWVKAMTRKADVEISFTETNKEVKLNVSYPVAKSVAVQEYIREQFKGIDLQDLSDASINHHRTSREPIQFKLTSNNGHLDIIMKKKENTAASCRRLKSMGDDINGILAD